MFDIKNPSLMEGTPNALEKVRATTTFSYLSIKLNFAEMPNNSDWLKLYGVGVLTGIGFTMSLFVGNLAFADAATHTDGVKIGVLLGSLLSTVFGYSLIFLGSKVK